MASMKKSRNRLGRAIRHLGYPIGAAKKAARRILADRFYGPADFLAQMALAGVRAETQSYDCAEHFPCGFEYFLVGPKGTIQVYGGSAEVESFSAAVQETLLKKSAKASIVHRTGRQMTPPSQETRASWKPYTME